MTELQPCTRKGCKAIAIHRHLLASGKKANGTTWDRWSDDALPRLTRKALAARLAAVEAECADLHAEIADKKDRLARAEDVGVVPVMWAVVDQAGDFIGAVRKMEEGGYSASPKGGFCSEFLTLDAAVAAVRDPDAPAAAVIEAALEKVLDKAELINTADLARAALAAAREAGAL